MTNAVVRDGLSSSSPSIVCIQETKLISVDMFKAATFLPSGVSAFSFVESVGTRGGILTAWYPGSFTLSSFIVRQHTLTTTLTSTSSDLNITITNVYAPSDHRESQGFLDDLTELSTHVSGNWIIAGAFNLMRDANDKNNDLFDFALADSFNNAINHLQLVKLPLLDRLFTWSNKRASPTLARLDRVFLNVTFSSAFPNISLTSSVRTTSDHTPLLISISTSLPKSPLFRFENGWLHHQDFLPAILPAWCYPGHAVCQLHSVMLLAAVETPK